MTSVSEGNDVLLVGLEHFPRFISRLLENYYHKSPHEIARVRQFVIPLRTIMVNFELLVVRVRQESCQLRAITMRLSQVERSEILVEWLINQVLAREKRKLTSSIQKK